jgi:tRNA threonylcarbamoyladenosine biosynthesis protein TsaB
MKGHPLMLIIETSGSLCSVAFADSTSVVSRTLEEPMQHASGLAPLVRELLQDVAVSPAELAALAVSMGPGSYTGLRIGLAFAKGYCHATGARLISLSTFDILRLSLFLRHPDTGGLPVALCLPSKKDHLYLSVYSAEGNILIPPENFPRDAWQGVAESLPQNTVIAGAGAASFADYSMNNSNFMRVLPDLEPAAEAAVPLALNAWYENRFTSLHEAQPLYLSGFNPRKAPPSVL